MINENENENENDNNIDNANNTVTSHRIGIYVKRLIEMLNTRNQMN